MGEVYYLKLADQIKDEFVATICVKKDNVTPLQTNILYTQSGQDKNIYQEFKTDKRSSQSIYLKPSNYSNKNVTFPVNRGGLRWNGQSDYVKFFAQETAYDNLELVLAKLPVWG